MKSNINLLQDKKKNQASILPTGAMYTLRFSAVSLLFIVSVSSIILFILISLSPLPKLKQQEQLALANLSQYHTDMLKLFLIKERTGVIQGILAKRTSYDTVLNAIQTKLPYGVEVRAMNIEKDTVLLTVSSGSLELLSTFIDSLTQLVTEKKTFSQITMSHLSIEQERKTYSVTLALLLL